MSEKQHTKHWWKGVAYNWRYFGTPLRPSSEDVAAMEKAVAVWGTDRSGNKCKALLWGVTPEIANMKWPDRTELVAVDRSEEMIQIVWPGDISGFRKACCGEWLDSGSLMLSATVVIGDGCFNTFHYPDGYRALLDTVYQVLTDEGILIMRFFIQPDEQENVETVFKELHANRIGNFHVFKFRLAMAMQLTVQSAVKVNDVWRVWKAAGIDEKTLRSMTGWRQGVIDTMALYEGKKARLSFPTFKELAAVFSERFKEVARTVPHYEMGERCPVLVFKKRPAKPS